MSVIARIVDERHGDVPIVTVEGEIDSSNARAIAQRMRATLSNQGKVLIVDLTPTTYIDSAGINVLFRLGVELRERQQELHVVVASPSPIARMLAIVGLDRAVPTHATRAAALSVVGVE
jgi:anti-sigma B factor antagonist